MRKFVDYYEQKKSIKSNSIEVLEKAFIEKKYPVEKTGKNEINVTNKKGFDVTIFLKGDKVCAAVPGYKSDIHLDEIGDDFKEVKSIVDSINLNWLREYDPHGDQW